MSRLCRATDNAVATKIRPYSAESYGADLLAAALLIVLLAVAATIGEAQEASIVVLVNDDPISDYDVDQRERFLAITTQQQPSPELKKKATDQLIDERLQMQQGRKLSVSVDDDDVNTIVEDMAKKNNLDVDGLATALGKAGVNIKTLKDRIKSQLMWQNVVRQKFRREIQIGDADVDKALADAGASEQPSGSPAETALQLRQVRYEVAAGADQKTIAERLAAAESVRAHFRSCADLAKGVEGATVKTLADQQPASLVQPARLLVMNAKMGQMTPPTLTASAVEMYAVCGKRSVRGDDKTREETQRKLMNEEMGLRAERLLRDLRQDAFIEYR
jgi:peptidyl-prolyl cis-trans isomerase SurA